MSFLLKPFDPGNMPSAHQQSNQQHRCFSRLFFSEIDNEGVIEPDTDEPQEMGEFENVEVGFYTCMCCLFSLKNPHLMFQPSMFLKVDFISPGHRGDDGPG